jgi:2-keto-4-pentenoate hydratase/2-oxohepta-3-ene-1,7-dioic acid hydratase in catechol pathway
MKVARIRSGEGAAYAVRGVDGTWVPFSALGIEAETTAELVAQAGALEGLSGLKAGLREVDFLAPIVAPSKVLAVALNYSGHIQETKAQRPFRPVVFAKFPNSINHPYGPIVVDPGLTEQADYEAELAVVIGRRTKGIAEASALSCVFGYTVANDVSARDWQRRDGQFSRSKSFDTFCPMGPWLTTAEEVPDPQDLRLWSWVNGEIRQDGSSKEMIFPVAHLIWYLTRGMTLEPGDVILTGTPPGVGSAMRPPRYLAAGDVVECEIEGLGRLSNVVVVPEAVASTAGEVA